MLGQNEPREYTRFFYAIQSNGPERSRSQTEPAGGRAGGAKRSSDADRDAWGQCGHDVARKGPAASAGERGLGGCRRRRKSSRPRKGCHSSRSRDFRPSTCRYTQRFGLFQVTQSEPFASLDGLGRWFGPDWHAGRRQLIGRQSSAVMDSVCVIMLAISRTSRHRRDPAYPFNFTQPARFLTIGWLR